MAGRTIDEVAKESAALLVGEGMSAAQTAELVEVDEATVKRWKVEPSFAQQAGRRRDELWPDASEKLREHVGRAVDVLGEDLYSDDKRLRQAAAIQVLRSVGLYKTSTAADPEPAWQRLLAALGA